MLVKLHDTNFTENLFSSVCIVGMCTDGQTVLSCQYVCRAYSIAMQVISNADVLKMYNFQRKCLQSCLL